MKPTQRGSRLYKVMLLFGLMLVDIIMHKCSLVASTQTIKNESLYERI